MEQMKYFGFLLFPTTLTEILDKILMLVNKNFSANWSVHWFDNLLLQSQTWEFGQEFVR